MPSGGFPRPGKPPSSTALKRDRRRRMAPEAVHDDWADHRREADVERLCALYDGLLAPGKAALPPAAERELKALAKIFDLDAERPAAELWPHVRAVLVRQAPPREDDAPPVEADPITVLLVE